jgi:acyl-coenzyme A thioesterase PaaI-like protein
MGGSRRSPRLGAELVFHVDRRSVGREVEAKCRVVWVGFDVQVAPINSWVGQPAVVVRGQGTVEALRARRP